MKYPGKLKQAGSNQIRSKKIGENVQIQPNMLLTITNNRLYPATHDSIIDGIAVDDVQSTTATIDGITYCTYYPYHPTTLYETEVIGGELTDHHVGQFFNLSSDGGHYVDVGSAGNGRQLRLENILNARKGEFTIRRDPYPHNGKPGAPGPQGIPGPQGAEGRQSIVPGPQGEQGIVGSQGPQGEQGAPGPQGKTITFSDFTTPQKLLLKGDKGDDGPQGAPGPQGPQGATGTPGQSILRGGKRNSGNRYQPMTIVHHEGSARITTRETINEEPGIAPYREIFAQGGHFLPSYA